MAVTVASNSRLNMADLVEVDGIEFFDLPMVPTFPESEDDIEIVVEENTRLDILAKSYYKDVTLQWVIMEANDIFLPPLEIKKGETLRIPHPDRVIGKQLKRREI